MFFFFFPKESMCFTGSEKDLVKAILEKNKKQKQNKGLCERKMKTLSHLPS
jgi:hypothetical protein